jgi:hypothetical protein
LIISFIYTECQAPGPFKSEPGFKIKELMLWKTAQGKVFHDTLRPDNSSAIEKSVMEAIGYLPHFEPPAMSPFITNSDFLALEKQWVFVRVPSGKYLFARMSTSGLTHGRRGNPFHSGILFDGESLGSMLSFWKKAKELPQVFSPVDLFSWHGWQDPRTTEDLEKVVLAPESFPMPILRPKKRAVDDRAYFQENRAEIRTAFMAVEKSFMTATPANFAAENSWDFMKQVSIVCSVLPPTLTWARNISSAPNNKFYEGKPGWTKAFLHAQAPVSGQASKSSWAHLAMLTFEKNKFAELEKMLSLVGAGLQWKATSGTSGLWFLPLAISLEAAGSPGFMNAEELALAHSLAIEHWPTDEVRFLGEAFKGSVLDRVSKFSWLNESEVKDLINRVNNIPVG